MTHGVTGPGSNGPECPRFAVASLEQQGERTTTQMFQTLQCSHNGNLYRVELHGVADIADLVREHLLETVTSSDGALAFWFTPSTHRSHMQINKQATELLLATTRFTARQVPLLHGNIVITGVDANGDPTGLTPAQMRWLINSEPAGREKWVLGRRFSRARRAQRREFRSTEATRMAAVMRPWR